MDEKEKTDDGSKDNVMFHGMKTPRYFRTYRAFRYK